MSTSPRDIPGYDIDYPRYLKFEPKSDVTKIRPFYATLSRLTTNVIQLYSMAADR